jgi:hypothetical protein
MTANLPDDESGRDSAEHDVDDQAVTGYATVCSACTLPADLAASWLVVDADTDAPCGCRVHRACPGLRDSDPFRDRCLCGRNLLMAFEPDGDETG